MSVFEKIVNSFRSFSLCIIYCLASFLVMTHVHAQTVAFNQQAQTMEIALWGDPTDGLNYGAVQITTDIVQNTVTVRPIFDLNSPAEEAMLSTALLSLTSSLPLVYFGTTGCPQGCDDLTCVSHLYTLTF